MSPPTTRSKRTSSRPKHLQDYIVDIEFGESSNKSQENDPLMEQKLDRLMQMFAETNAGIGSTIDLSISTNLSSLKTSLESKMEEVRQDISNVQTNFTALTARIDHLQSQIEASQPSPSRQENVNALTVRVDELQRHVGSLPSSQMNQHSSGSSVSTETQEPHSVCTTIMRKMRKLIDLPVFNGDPKDWPNFISEFDDTTKSEAYTTLDNNSRLKKSLSGQAREVVDSMLIHHENVPDVIERLRARFGRPDKIIRTQMEIVRSVAPISENRMELLIPFADKVNNMKNVLKSCKSEHCLSNPTLLEELVLKLPYSKRWQWQECQSMIEPHATIEHFSKWLNKIADLADGIPSTSLQPKYLDKRGRVLFVSENKTLECPVCQCDHKIRDCTTYLQMEIDDKWNLVTQLKLCFKCLDRGHHTKKCKKESCGNNGCKRDHHISLHKNKTMNVNAPVFEIQRQDEDQNRVLCTQAEEANVLFKIVPVILYGPHGEKRTLALIDEASTLTLINKDIAKHLGLKGEKRLLSIRGIEKNSQLKHSEVSDVRISGTYPQAPIYDMRDIQIVDDMDLPTQTINIAHLLKKFQHLQHLPIEGFNNGRPEILIGLNHANLGLPIKAPTPVDSGPIPILTKLGYILYGPKENKDDINSLEISKERVLITNGGIKLDELHEMVKDHFSTENFGVRVVNQLIPKDEKEALHILENTIKYIGGRYECGLIWKSSGISLPDSYGMALKRLFNTERKMLKDEKYAALYRATIDNYLQKGYARKLSSLEVHKKPSRTWYLPHFGVVNPNKPDKFRLVFDAAAKSHGTCLNANLLTGPDLNQPLIKVLWRFREKPVGVCADISEMFHQVKIRDDDQSAQRFLWRDDPNKPVDVYVMEAMTFGSSSSPTTAQFVKNSNAMKYIDECPDAVTAITHGHYVDDYVMSFSREEEAIRITKDVIKIHENAGFHLRNFISNSRNVIQAVNGCVSKSSVNMDIDGDEKPDKILGLHWKVINDSFTFLLKFARIPESVLKMERKPTKRELLAIAMSIFDPFGFISNISIYVKLLVQQLWKTDILWDDEIPKTINDNWKSWFDELQQVQNIKIPRCYSLNLFSANRIQLHTFVDASMVAFSAVSYLRIVHDNGVDIAFVAGKSKCAPLKTLSIPRLELQAAVLGTRLQNTVLESHTFQINESFFWSDSMTVLFWIKDDQRRYKEFIRNRVSEILENNSADQWNYMPTADNVADDATRDVYPPNFSADNRWLSGPEWLKMQNNWPTQPTQLNKIEADQELVKSTSYEDHRVLLLQSSQPLVEMTKFSNLLKLKRVVGWVLRFVNNLSAKRCHKSGRKGSLVFSELQEAEELLCRQSQQQGFAEDYIQLKDKNNKLSNTFKKMLPYIDEKGVMRVYGRIDYAPTIPIFVKRPIIMAKEHHLSLLIVRHFHEIHHHQFDELTISEIRLRFWIFGVRTLLRKVKSICPSCIHRTAIPRQPMMGQIPVERLTPFVRPFSYSGVDYFGPVNVAIGRRREKKWVALFTCLSTRAVHLEISDDLSSDSFIMCLRNFINLRGVPVQIRSDNGTNFVGALGEMVKSSEFFGSATIKNKTAKEGIEWKFNTPADPAAGGIWERMVQSVKRILKDLLKDVAPRTETLRSFLLEAANIINSRPLTHIPISYDDEDPLTPNSFLLGCPNSIQTVGPTDEKLWCLRKQWRISQNLKNHFWRRFIREYLPTLTRREKWCKRVDPIKPGDIVLICDENLARNEWRRGVIESTAKAKDGQVRSALVKTTNGFLRRPASKLAVLDIKSSSSEHLDESTGDGMSHNQH